MLINSKKNQINLLSIVYSIFLTSSILLLFFANSEDIRHFFIIPIYFCGVILGIDIINWLRGRVDTFDPVGFIGIFGYHFFFVSPLLFVYWDMGMNYVVEPNDWRIWLFGMGCINFTGLILYKIVINNALVGPYNKVVKYKSVWTLNTKKLLIVTLPVMFIMFLLQTYIYISFGGFDGYINSYVNRDGSFEGMGILFLISESFPIVFLILVIHIWSKSTNKKGFIAILILFIVYFILKLYFGGLRGSRSNTLWGIIWFAGLIHIFVRQLSKKIIFIGTVIMLCFVLVYGIYKGAVGEGLDVFKSEESILEIADNTGRGIDTVLIGDFSRTNVQAFILYRLVMHKDEYDYALGRSYIGNASILIPKRIYPNRQPTKVKEGTEIILGKDSFNPNGYVSSRIHGLTGEFMLNFGFILAPFAFCVFAYFVLKVKTFYLRLYKQDARLYLYPFMIVMTFLLLVQDLDNFIYSIFKNFLIPLFIIYLCSEKKYISCKKVI